MSNTIKVLVIKDKEGVLRPMAGIWGDDPHGKISVEYWKQKNKKTTDTIVQATLTETSYE